MMRHTHIWRHGIIFVVADNGRIIDIAAAVVVSLSALRVYAWRCGARYYYWRGWRYYIFVVFIPGD